MLAKRIERTTQLCLVNVAILALALDVAASSVSRHRGTENARRLALEFVLTARTARGRQHEGDVRQTIELPRLHPNKERERQLLEAAAVELPSVDAPLPKLDLESLRRTVFQVESGALREIIPLYLAQQVPPAEWGDLEPDRQFAFDLHPGFTVRLRAAPAEAGVEYELKLAHSTPFLAAGDATEIQGAQSEAREAILVECGRWGAKETTAWESVASLERLRWQQQAKAARSLPILGTKAGPALALVLLAILGACTSYTIAVTLVIVRREPLDDPGAIALIRDETRSSLGVLAFYLITPFFPALAAAVATWHSLVSLEGSLAWLFVGCCLASGSFGAWGASSVWILRRMALPDTTWRIVCVDGDLLRIKGPEGNAIWVNGPALLRAVCERSEAEFRPSEAP